MGLVQIGEFSFIIASLGLSLKVTSQFLYPIAVTVSAITTLLTPYLIKSSDRLVEFFDRHASKAVVRNLELYTQWVGRLGRNGKGSMASRLIRKWLLQIILNMVLMGAVFIGASLLAQHPLAWLPGIFHGENSRTALWLLGAMLSLPLLIANYRKLQALGMLIADLRMSVDTDRARKASIQTVVSQVIALTGTAGMALLALLFSSALLPPTRVLLVLLLILSLIVWLLWRSFVRVYSKAQFALQETFAEMPGQSHSHESHAAPLSGILKDAKLDTLLISKDSPFAGKLIREIQLRTQTGTSIVGIQRKGTSIVNPGPDEELLVGDEILIIGLEGQLNAVRELFGETETSRVTAQFGRGRASRAAQEF